MSNELNYSPQERKIIAEVPVTDAGCSYYKAFSRYQSKVYFIDAYQ
jgi:hypothetical protein